MPSKLWDVETWAQLPFPRESQNVCELRRIVTKQRMLGLLISVTGPALAVTTVIQIITWRNHWELVDDVLATVQESKASPRQEGELAKTHLEQYVSSFHVRIWTRTSQLALKHIFAWQKTYWTGTHQDVLPHIDSADKRSHKKIGSSDHSGVFNADH